MATPVKAISAKRTAPKSEILHGISDARLIAAYAGAQPWLRRDYVTGIGIGYAWKDGKPTLELALSVHVKKRMPDHKLSRRQRFPRMLMGVRVDVIEANMVTHLSPDEELARRFNPAIPLRPGVLMQAAGGKVGTVALLVKSRSSQASFVLGSGHVMDSARDFFQPAGGTTDSLALSVQRVERSVGDAGIASYSNREARNQPVASSTLINSARHVRLDDELTISGAFSGNKIGVVAWIGLKTIHYKDGRVIKVPGFQLRPKKAFDPLSRPGDSGALWFDAAGGAAVGINVGGGLDGGNEDIAETNKVDNTQPWAYACHIVDMMDLLDLRL